MNEKISFLVYIWLNPIISVVVVKEKQELASE
jgi:hypothetical protein